jgi:hypothetical protein
VTDTKLSHHSGDMATFTMAANWLEEPNKGHSPTTSSDQAPDKRETIFREERVRATCASGVPLHASLCASPADPRPTTTRTGGSFDDVMSDKDSRDEYQDDEQLIRSCAVVGPDPRADSTAQPTLTEFAERVTAETINSTALPTPPKVSTCDLATHLLAVCARTHTTNSNSQADWVLMLKRT